MGFSPRSLPPSEKCLQTQMTPSRASLLVMTLAGEVAVVQRTVREGGEGAEARDGGQIMVAGVIKEEAPTNLWFSCNREEKKGGGECCGLAASDGVKQNQECTEVNLLASIAGKEGNQPNRGNPGNGEQCDQAENKLCI